MRVAELLQAKSPSVITVDATADVGTAARLLMAHTIGGLPVVSGGGELVGFVAERDIVRVVDSNTGVIRDLPVERIMRRPAPTCTGDDTLEHLMERMTSERLRHVVVVDGGRIAGVVSVGDLIKHRLTQLTAETGVLRDYVAGRRAMPESHTGR